MVPAMAIMTITITAAPIIAVFDELFELAAAGDGEFVVVGDEELELVWYGVTIGAVPWRIGFCV